MAPPGVLEGPWKQKWNPRGAKNGIKSPRRMRWDAVQMEQRSQRMCSMATAAGSINRRLLSLPPQRLITSKSSGNARRQRHGTLEQEMQTQGPPSLFHRRATLPPTAKCAPQQANERRRADNKGKREKGSSRQMLRQGPIRHSAPRLLSPRGDKPLGLVSPERWRRPRTVPSTCSAAGGAARRPGTGYARTPQRPSCNSFCFLTSSRRPGS